MARGQNLKDLPDRLRCTAIVRDKRSTRVGERCLAHRVRNPEGGYFDKCSAHLGIPQAAARVQAEDKRLLTLGVPKTSTEDERARMIEEATRRNEERQREREERARRQEILDELEEANREAVEKATRLTPEQLEERRLALVDRDRAQTTLAYLDPSEHALVLWIEARQHANDATFQSYVAAGRLGTVGLVYPHPELVGLDPQETAEKCLTYLGGLEPTFARMQDANEHHVEHNMHGPPPFPRAGFREDSEYRIVWSRAYGGARVMRKPRPFAPIGSANWRNEAEQARRQQAPGYPTVIDRS